MTDSTDDAAKPDQPGVRVVAINRQPIELFKVLKFENMAATGGMAKAAVAAGKVLVNGQIETQKRKKIVSGDTIEFNNDKIRVELTEKPIETELPVIVEPDTASQRVPQNSAQTDPIQGDPIQGDPVQGDPISKNAQAAESAFPAQI